MAGFWHLSHHQMRDQNGLIMAGAKAYFFEAATTNPITVYQDYGLGTAHPNPVVANGRGVFPPVFLDEEDGFYRQRITNAEGVLVDGTDVGTLPIIGPGEGGGGAEVPVDENALLKTGDFFWQPRSGSRSGFVRANGRTIGSAISGAAERANADCEALYLFNWATFSDIICPVTGGRGVSAAADWAANKPMALPDGRNKAAFGLPDMGNTDSGAFNSVVFDVGTKTSALAQGGDAGRALVRGNLPNTSVPVTITDPGHTHPYTAYAAAGAQITGSGGVQISQQNLNTSSALTGISASFNLNGNVTQTEVEIMPPFMLGTWYQKL